MNGREHDKVIDLHDAAAIRITDDASEDEQDEIVRHRCLNTCMVRTGSPANVLYA